MAKGGRIPTPPAQLWRRFRYRYMPMATFALLGVVVLMLWQRHAGGPALPAEFFALTREARSTLAGQLVQLEARPPIRIGQYINAGEVVARLDPAPLMEELAVAEAEIVALREQINAEVETQRLDELERRLDVTDSSIRHDADVLRLEQYVEELELQIAEQTVLAQYAKTLVELAKRKLRVLPPLPASDQRNNRQLTDGSLTKFEQSTIVSAEIERGTAEQQLAFAEKSMEVLKAQQAAAIVRLNRLRAKSPVPPNLKAEVDALTAPLKAAVDVQVATLSQLRVNLQFLEVKAPISGVVRTILLEPGQPVQAGEPIMTIASDTSNLVIGYLPENEQLAVHEGDRVTVRTRVRPRQSVEGVVTRIGPHFEQLPVLHTPTRDLNLPAFGMPIWVEVPEGGLPGAFPGSPVDLLLQSNDDPADQSSARR